MTEKPSTCEGCPAYTKGVGFVPPAVPQDPGGVRVAVVGSAPGEQEVEVGKPFFADAPAGSVLTRWLHGAGLPRSTMWVGGLVQCWIPKFRKGGRGFGSVDHGLRMQWHCWRVHVEPSLRSLPNLEYIVTVGTLPRQFFLGPGVGERYCGTFVKGNLPEGGSDGNARR